MCRNHAVVATLRFASAAATTAALALLPLARATAHPVTDVTWTRDVRRILEYRCAGCHHRAGAGPMDLTDYAQARQWGQALKRSVLERRMPPWQAAPGFGDFVNDRRLTPYEMQVIAAWVNGGMRVGPPQEGQPAPSRVARFEATTELSGAPMSVTTATQTIEVPPDPHDRWIAGWEFRPGDASPVMAATITIGRAVLGTWTPGDVAVVWPQGVAHRLPADVPIRITARYRDVHSSVVDHSRLAVRLTRHPRRDVAHIRLTHGSHRLPGAVDVLAVRPTLSSGDALQVTARLPDGAVQVLLVIDKYDADAPVTYQFRIPVPLPAGTRIDVQSFDRACHVTLDYAAVPGATRVRPEP